MKILSFVLAAFMAVVASAADEEPPKTPGANDEDPADGEGIEFKHFLAHSANQTCSADSHARPFNNQIRGVNLGGWLVLEPWITPSLFYQFLGGDETNTAFDTYTFCEVLGPVEGNIQLRRHWESWVTEDIIKDLAESGAVNSLRLPVGDFMYKPYGPYSKFLYVSKRLITKFL
jgi:glucan 1,3-beta-glucosidase